MRLSPTARSAMIPAGPTQPDPPKPPPDDATLSLEGPPEASVFAFAFAFALPSTPALSEIPKRTQPRIDEPRRTMHIGRYGLVQLRGSANAI